VRGTLTLFIPRYLLASPAVEAISPDGWPLDPGEFGRQLRRVRNAVKLSQKQLAKKAGCTEVTVRLIEKGRVTAQGQTRKCLIGALAQHSEKKPNPGTPTS